MLLGAQHRGRGDGQVAGGRDTGVAGVDDAARCKQEHIARRAACADRRLDTAARHCRRKLGDDIAERIEAHHRRRNRQGRLGAAAGVDIAARRPHENAAAIECEYT